VGYLSANFGLSGPLCSRLRPDLFEVFNEQINDDDDDDNGGDDGDDGDDSPKNVAVHTCPSETSLMRMPVFESSTGHST